MACEKCGADDATIHETQISKGQVVSLHHWCVTCGAHIGRNPGSERVISQRVIRLVWDLPHS